jgi:hypothetical protein
MARRVARLPGQPSWASLDPPTLGKLPSKFMRLRHTWAAVDFASAESGRL